jgi:hypothetical protein
VEESCRETGDWCCSVCRRSERSRRSVVIVECRKVLADSSWTTATVQQPFLVKGDRDQRLNNVRGGQLDHKGSVLSPLLCLVCFL